jgi:O-antigen ligase
LIRARDIRAAGDAAWTVALAVLGVVALAVWKAGASPTVAGLLFTGVLLGGLFRPRAGLYLVILTAPIRGILFLGEDGFSATRMLGLTVAIGACLVWLRQGRLPRVGWPAVPLVALVALAATSILPGPNPSDGAAVLTLAQFVLLAVVVADFASEPRGAVELSLVLVASAMMTALMMLGDYVPFALAANEAEPTRFMWRVDPQSTLLGTFFATGVLASIAVWSEPSARVWRVALAAMSVPVLVAIVVLNSRLAGVALVVGIVAFALAGRGLARRAPLAAGFVLALVLLAASTAGLGLWDPGMRYRAQHSLDSPYEATSGRTVIWKVGAQVFAENPVRGVGLSRFPEHFERIRTASDPTLRSKPSRTPHSDFIGLAAELGIAGTILLVAALILLAVPLLKRDGSHLAPASFGWLMMLATLMLGLDMTTQWQTWVGLGVVMGVGYGGAGEVARRAAQAPSER